MVDFSLVSYTRDVVETDPEGEREYSVVESMYGERNDAVGYAEGAMEQKTNSREETGEGDNMSKKAEVFETLVALKTNAEVTLPEIAKALGLSDQIITEDQKMNLGAYDQVKKLCGESPVEFINSLLDEKKANAESVREAKFNELFGDKVNKVTGKTNHAREFAAMLIGDAELTDEKVNEVKENETFKALAVSLADKDSDFNRIVETDKEDKPAGPIEL